MLDGSLAGSHLGSFGRMGLREIDIGRRDP